MSIIIREPCRSCSRTFPKIYRDDTGLQNHICDQCLIHPPKRIGITLFWIAFVILYFIIIINA